MQTRINVPQGQDSTHPARTPVIEFGIACCVLALAVVLAVAIAA